MARYAYDESGSMASYFILTFLALILVPLSFSLASRERQKVLNGCQCTPCLEQRERIRKREKGAWFNPQMGLKTSVTLGGWALFAFVAYKAAGNVNVDKVYDPFEILGISQTSTEKEIKSWFKKLSKQYHPDKVKLVGNMTIDAVQARFVEITKAYKSLTDEVTRENFEKYGNPDGPQETTMGIALPPWIIAAQNNIWVLGVYGVLFGGALPALVGRWWFGNRARTKDGVDTRTAARFFRALREEADVPDVVGALGQAAEWDAHKTPAVSQRRQHLDALEAQIAAKAGDNWKEVLRLAQTQNDHAGRREALVLLYAHLLRLTIDDPTLQKDQTAVLLQTPTLLSALLSITLARNWLQPTLAAMRLHAYITQALLPRVAVKKGMEVGQLPKMAGDESAQVVAGGDVKDMSAFASKLAERGDERVADVNKALRQWPRLDLVDVSFKVIDERIVTPMSIVYLVVKLRLSPPTADATPAQKTEDALEDADAAKKRVRASDAKDYAFLTSKLDAEELPAGADTTIGWAHAPHWPARRRPGWWMVLADDKSNRVVVPPMRLADVPFARPDAPAGRDYRSYKLQFQAPQNVGVYTWKLYLVSDSYVGEELERAITLKIEDPAALTAEEQGAEDDISEPDEDSLAGQMAVLRGGGVKKANEEEEDDDESGTDDDEESDSDSSDSDSD